MRNIIFRGKHIKDGDWVYGYYAETVIIEPRGHIYGVDADTVGEFTGFDIHGLLVYEGDILFDKATGEKYTVCFADGAWRLSKGSVIGGFLHDYLKHDSLEVIGNIHDGIYAVSPHKRHYF